MITFDIEKFKLGENEKKFISVEIEKINYVIRTKKGSTCLLTSKPRKRYVKVLQQRKYSLLDSCKS